jgi:hypothetical protein
MLTPKCSGLIERPARAAASSITTLLSHGLLRVRCERCGDITVVVLRCTGHAFSHPVAAGA